MTGRATGAGTESDAAEPDVAEPGAAEPDAADLRAAEPGTAEPGTAEPRAAAPRAAEPGAAKPHAADLRTAEPDPERRRLEEAREGRVAWYRWDPYLADRQWGAVREDYSANGDAWNYLPHDHARSRAYRWGEDGLLGISDQHSRLCFSIALWNERDPILKERLFGLSGPEG